MNPMTKYYGLTNSEFLSVAEPLLDFSIPLVQELFNRLARSDPSQRPPPFSANPDANYSLRANR